MAFLGSMIAQAQNTHSDSGLRPREPRQRTLIKATVSGLRLAAQPALVRNVSQGGLGLATQGELPAAGDHLSVDFANGLWVSGKVAWVAGNAFGLALDRPISVEQLEKATQRQNAGLGRAMAWHVEQAFTPRAPGPRLCAV